MLPSALSEERLVRSVAVGRSSFQPVLPFWSSPCRSALGEWNLGTRLLARPLTLYIASWVPIQARPVALDRLSFGTATKGSG